MEPCHYEQNISEIAEDCTTGNIRGAEAIVLSDHEMHLYAVCLCSCKGCRQRVFGNFERHQNYRKKGGRKMPCMIVAAAAKKMA